jgi:ATP adenylyltransferase
VSLLVPGTLWHRARTQSDVARASGALEPWATEVVDVDDAGGHFQVRVMASLEAKQRAPKTPGDPFAWPWRGDLVVGDVSPTHGCLLNKFPVFPNHLLLVTRAYEPQDAWLTPEDGDALRRCLDEDGETLGFYNGGTGAGASQPHKHLQVVPLRATLEPLIRAGALPVRHALVDTPTNGAVLAAEVSRLLQALHVAPGAAWNLLATRDWLLVVPRAAESFEGVSVNALGFAGSLLVKSRAQLERLREVGPMAVLRAVGLPP